MLAAAIRAGAQAIVTFNLADFPADRLAPYNIDAKHPDDFVIDTLDISPGAVAKVIADQAAALKNPPRSGCRSSARLPTAIGAGPSPPPLPERRAAPSEIVLQRARRDGETLRREYRRERVQAVPHASQGEQLGRDLLDRFDLRSPHSEGAGSGGSARSSRRSSSIRSGVMFMLVISSRSRCRIHRADRCRRHDRRRSHVLN